MKKSEEGGIDKTFGMAVHGVEARRRPARDGKVAIGTTGDFNIIPVEEQVIVNDVRELRTCCSLQAMAWHVCTEFS